MNVQKILDIVKPESKIEFLFSRNEILRMLARKYKNYDSFSLKVFLVQEETLEELNVPKGQEISIYELTKDYPGKVILVISEIINSTLPSKTYFVFKNIAINSEELIPYENWWRSKYVRIS